MDIGNYSLEILEILNGSRTRRHEGKGTGYVPMRHGEYFWIRIRSHTGQRTLAEVMVNGQDCGTFVMARYDTVTIERPVHAEYKFQFYRIGSTEAQGAELWQGDAANGLVQVKFRPEVVRKSRTLHTLSRAPFSKRRRGGGAQSLAHTPDTLEVGMMGTPGASSGYEEGGIGLGEHSDQQFQQVSGFETDPAETVTISLRLVHRSQRDDRPKPIRGPRANSVPPPVG